MRHGLYYRLHPCNDNCITEMESICNQKNIMYVTSEFMYIRDKVVKYFMKKIVVFVEKHYISKNEKKTKNHLLDTIIDAEYVLIQRQHLIYAVCVNFQYVLTVSKNYKHLTVHIVDHKTLQKTYRIVTLSVCIQKYLIIVSHSFCVLICLICYTM